MEIFGGFMVMLSIIGFFLTIIWFLTPFVIFSIKGRTDRILQLVEEMDRRMKHLEDRLNQMGENGKDPETTAPGHEAAASVAVLPVDPE